MEDGQAGEGAGKQQAPQMCTHFRMETCACATTRSSRDVVCLRHSAASTPCLLPALSNAHLLRPCTSSCASSRGCRPSTRPMRQMPSAHTPQWSAVGSGAERLRDGLEVGKEGACKSSPRRIVPDCSVS